MKSVLFACVAVAGFGAAPALGQTAPAAATATSTAQIVAGTQVVDPSGNPVGTISSVGPTYVVLKTDKHEVRLSKDSFAFRPEGLMFSLTKDQLNAQVEQSVANIDDLLTPGAMIHDRQRAMVGTVEAVEGDLVTLKLASGAKVRLPKSGFAPGADGAVIGLTAEQLQAQVPTPTPTPAEG
jgi:preprotein translocase subunit YajC